MCAECVDACREVFPEVSDDDMGDFLYGTTCFPFGGPGKVREQLVRNRARMQTTDWRECYAIVDALMSEQMEQSLAARAALSP
jgi:hypothetical protein